MQDADAAPCAVGVDPREPLPDALVERHAAARFLERLAAQRQPLRLGLLDHACHVGQHHVGVLPLGQRVGLGPELPVALAHGGDEVVLLHVARRERAVEIVDEGYGESEIHRHSPVFGIPNIPFFHYFCKKSLKTYRLWSSKS